MSLAKPRDGCDAIEDNARHRPQRTSSWRLARLGAAFALLVGLGGASRTTDAQTLPNCTGNETVPGAGCWSGPTSSGPPARAYPAPSRTPSATPSVGIMPMMPVSPTPAIPSDTIAGAAGRVAAQRSGLDLSDPAAQVPPPSDSGASAAPPPRAPLPDTGPNIANCGGYPQTRPGIVACFRDGSAYTAAKARECENDASDLASVQQTTAEGATDNAPYGQRQSFLDCAANYQRGAQAQDCAAQKISTGMQVNPAVAMCRRQYGIN